MNTNSSLSHANNKKTTSIHPFLIMAVNLIDLAKTYLTSDVISRVSNLLGEQPSNTERAFDSALPAVLSGLIDKSTEPGGPGSIMDMIGQVMTPNRMLNDEATIPGGGIGTQLTDLLSTAGKSGSLIALGSVIIQNLFGSKTEAVAGAVASASGINETSAASVLSIAGSVVLSALGRSIADTGTGIAGLTGLLSSQTAGTGAVLGGIIGKESSEMVSPNKTGGQGAPFLPHTGTAPAGKSRGWWYPWLLLLLAVIPLIYLIRSCSDKGGDSASSTNTTLDSTAASVEAAVNSAESAVGSATDSIGAAGTNTADKLGASIKRKLPSGVELNVPENGIESKLVQFINDTDKPVDQTTWFNFDRLLFDTGKSTLKQTSKEEITNMAQILKAFPAVNIKIGGYTDNTGSAQTNKKLSQDRADVVMAELVQLGIDKARLAAEGYGPEHPVASNDTEAGRAENRRIAVRVTKK
jgi:outer membrane protein OmpA-like peptidoglycan-associated protein